MLINPKMKLFPTHTQAQQWHLIWPARSKWNAFVCSAQCKTLGNFVLRNARAPFWLAVIQLRMYYGIARGMLCKWRVVPSTYKTLCKIRTRNATSYSIAYFWFHYHYQPHARGAAVIYLWILLMFKIYINNLPNPLQHPAVGIPDSIKI